MGELLIQCTAFGIITTAFLRLINERIISTYIPCANNLSVLNIQCLNIQSLDIYVSLERINK